MMFFVIVLTANWTTCVKDNKTKICKLLKSLTVVGCKKRKWSSFCFFPCFLLLRYVFYLLYFGFCEAVLTGLPILLSSAKRWFSQLRTHGYSESIAKDVSTSESSGAATAASSGSYELFELVEQEAEFLKALVQLENVTLFSGAFADSVRLAICAASLLTFWRGVLFEEGEY